MMHVPCMHVACMARKAPPTGRGRLHDILVGHPLAPRDRADGLGDLVEEIAIFLDLLLRRQGVFRPVLVEPLLAPVHHIAQVVRDVRHLLKSF